MPFDFPNSPTVGQSVTASNGATYVWDGAKWTVSGGGGIPDAPNDSATYGRHALGWVSVLPTVGGNLTGTLNMASHSIIQLADPVLGTDAATKSYVDGKVVAGGSVTSITAGTGLNGGTITVSGTISLANTAVTAGSYTNTNLTVDAQGRITAAANGPAYAPIASPALTGTPTAPTAAPGTNTTQIATTAFVAPAYNDVGRNLIHNPLFNVQQHGVGPWTTNATYTADRWLLLKNNDTVSVSINTAAPGGVTGDEASTNYLYVNTTGSATAGSYTYVEQHVEKLNRTSSKTLTLSFYCGAGSGTPRVGVQLFQVFGTGGSPSATVVLALQTFTISTTWTRYTAVFNVPSIAGKTLGSNGDDYLAVRFSLSDPSSAVGAQTAVMAFWGVQLEIGSVATPLEKPDPQQDLAKCQRFYQIGYVQLAASNGLGSAVTLATVFPFPVPMRAGPTVTPNFTTVTGVTGQGMDAPTSYTYRVNATINASAAYNLAGTFTASADL